MQYLKHTVVALSAILVGVGCSDNHSQRELTEEAIQLNNGHVTHGDKTLISQGAINPKTQYLKHDEDVKVVPAVDTTKHVTISKSDDSHIKIKKLITERDASIRANVELKKINADFKTKQSTLTAKIEELMKAQNKNDSSSKEKIAASATALLATQQLASDKDSEIAKLIKERDEAIHVTLEMKKASADFETQISELNKKIQALMQTQSENESLSKEKIEKLAAALAETDKLTQEKNAAIATLTKEKDAAIQVAMGMRKTNADFETRVSQAEDEASKLIEDRKREIDKLTNDLSHMNDNITRETEAKQKAIDALSELKTKLTTSATELSNAQSLISDKEAEIAKLIAERDEAIKVTLEMKKANTEIETKGSQAAKLLEDRKREIDKLTNDLSHMNDNITRETETKQKAIDALSELKTKLTASTTELSNAQSLISDKEAEIAKLIAERDEAIKVTLEMKKANEKLTIKLNNLMQIQSNNESASKEKIATSASALEAAQKLITDKDAEIAKLIAERDEAIKVTLEMKKENENFESQKSNWNTKIQSLMQTQDKCESSSKEKIAAAAAALLVAQQSASDRDSEIAKLIKERDEAIRVTLEMKKARADFEAQTSELNGKIQALMKTQSEHESLSKEKIEKLATALAETDKAAQDKDKTIETLTKEKDAAIQVSMGMKKDCADFEKSIQESTKNESIAKEKISKLASLLSEAEKSTLDKEADIARLTKERDAAIQVSMGMQKKLEEGKKASDEHTKKLVINNIVSTFKLSKVEFKTGSAILTDKSTELLDRVADIMKGHTEYHYKIQGHTDSQGKKESNLKLSQARAESVKNYLVSKGIADSILSSEGLGSSVPIADNASKEGRSQNRRVVFEIVD